MDNNQKNNQGPQMDISPDVAQGVYSNLAIITHSASDFVLDFARMLPGMPRPMVGSRVIMVPEHAKRLLMALQENVYKYESNFGEIRIHDQQPRTIAPFGKDRGEA